MEANDRLRLIERYRAGSAALAAVVVHLTESELDKPAPNGGMTARQIVHHTADGEIITSLRLRSLLSGDSIGMARHNEDEFCRCLHYDTRPIDASLALIKATRDASAEILSTISEAQWQVTYENPDTGRVMTPQSWLESYAEHTYNHANDIQKQLDGD